MITYDWSFVARIDFKTRRSAIKDIANPRTTKRTSQTLRHCHHCCLSITAGQFLQSRPPSRGRNADSYQRDFKKELSLPIKSPINNIYCVVLRFCKVSYSGRTVQLRNSNCRSIVLRLYYINMYIYIYKLLYVSFV